MVTIVDKANVFRAFAFMRKVFYEVATEFPDVESRHHYIDAMALDLVRRPWDFDVLPTENLFGDILSDLGAGLIGGMGFAPSADIGDAHGLFQPSHGSAPDIAGKGIANPTAMILSLGMMLRWLGERRRSEGCAAAADEIDGAVDAAFGSGAVRSYDIGGRDGTGAIARAVIERIGKERGPELNAPRAAAVAVDQGALEVGGERARQETDELADLLRLAEARHAELGEVELARFRLVDALRLGDGVDAALETVRLDGARIDRVDAHAVA
jgi:hypothetical protein